MKFLLLLFTCALAGAPARAFEIDEIHGCGTKHSPQRRAQSNCKDFDSTSAFTSQPAVQEAKLACLEFFEKTWEANNLLCSFTSDIKLIQDLDAALSALKNSRHPADLRCLANGEGQRIEADLNLRDHKMRRAYLESIRTKYTQLRKAGEAYVSKIARLNEEGMNQAAAEMNCSFRQNSLKASLAPGMLKIGLAAKAQTDLGLTTRRLLPALRHAGNELSPGRASGLLPSRKITVRKNSLIFDNEEKVEIKTIPDEEADRPSTLFSAMNNMMMHAGDKAGNRALAKWGMEAARGTEAEAKNRIPLLLRRLPIAGMATSGLAAGAQYYVMGSVPLSDLLSYGALMFSYGASLAVDAAAGLNEMAQEKKRRFSQFAGPFLEQHPDATSAEVARAWQKERFVADYKAQHGHPEKEEVEWSWENQAAKAKEEFARAYRRMHKDASLAQAEKAWTTELPEARREFEKAYRKKNESPTAPYLAWLWEAEKKKTKELFVKEYLAKHPESKAALAELAWLKEPRYGCEVADPAGAPARRPGWDAPKGDEDEPNDPETDKRSNRKKKASPQESHKKH